MASHQQPTLSAWQKATLSSALLLGAGKTVLGFIFSLAVGRHPGWPLKRSLANAFLKGGGVRSLEHQRSISPTTGNAIADFARSNGLSHEAERIDCGDETPPATLHFINCRPQDSGLTLLYLHGGGYVNPIYGKGHTPFALECSHACAARNLVFLEYSLAPELKYPVQLVQAVAAVEWLLRHRSPSDLILGGDSAGGNLALALLAHAKKPSPHASPISAFAAGNVRFRAALLISPWVRLETDAASYRVNGSRDYVSALGAGRVQGRWGPDIGEVWANPMVGSDDFWTSVPVDRVLLTVGTWEAFLDDVSAMAAKMGAEPSGSGSPVELALSKNEVHVQCVVDQIMGLPPGYMATSILEWLGRL